MIMCRSSVRGTWIRVRELIPNCKVLSAILNIRTLPFHFCLKRLSTRPWSLVLLIQSHSLQMSTTCAVERIK